MSCEAIRYTTAFDKKVQQFEWKIQNWSNRPNQEFRTETIELPGLDTGCYFIFNLDASSVTSGLTNQVGNYLIGLCSDNKISTKVLSCSLRGKGTNPYKFGVYASSYYNKVIDHRVSSLMMSPNSFTSNTQLLIPYVIDNTLIVDIQFEYYHIDDLIDASKIYKMESNVLKNYHLPYEHQELCDVTFLIGDEEIKAHTFVLIVVSPYFLSMFTGDNKESKDRIVNYSNDPDVNPEVFRGFLNYIYGIKSIQDLDDMIYELLVLSDKFDVETLKKDCEQYLAQKINDENIAKVLYSAYKFNCSFLKRVAMKYAKKDISVLSKSKEFEDLLKDTNLMTELLIK